jgi:hypothetical protein
MAQVDSENSISMPVDPTRRKFLIVSAVASVVSSGTLAAATMATNIPQATPATMPSLAVMPDPAFALIAAMRAAHAAHGEACGALAEAEERYGFNSAEAEDVYERGGAACHASYAAAWSLATTPPTTLAGIIAVLRFANQFEDEGMEWPDTDTIGPDGWHYQLRATMAAAIEALIKAQAGKAVRS